MKTFECNLEFSPTIHDYQWGPGLNFKDNAVDLVALSNAQEELDNTPLTPQPIDYGVRSTYDSRPINSYDFNFTATNIPSLPNFLWLTGWQVPLGYRAIVRKFEVIYDQDTGGPFGNSVIFPLQSLYPSATEDLPAGFPVTVPSYSTVVPAGNAVGFPVPNNVKAIGSGGSIDTFFICEEGTWFGIQGINTNIATEGTVTINVYGNFLAIRDEQLPFVIGNKMS